MGHPNVFSKSWRLRAFRASRAFSIGRWEPYTEFELRPVPKCKVSEDKCHPSRRLPPQHVPGRLIRDRSIGGSRTWSLAPYFKPYSVGRGRGPIEASRRGVNQLAPSFSFSSPACEPFPPLRSPGESDAGQAPAHHRHIQFC